MAANTNKDSNKEVETAKEFENAQEVETAKDPMKEMETIYLPKVPGEDASLFVSLNGYTCLIPRGKSTEVPKPIANIIHRSEKAKEDAEAFAEAERKKADTVMGTM